MWTLESAVRYCYRLTEHLRPVGFGVGLTGSVLTRYIVGVEEVHAIWRKKGSLDEKHVEVWRERGRLRIDIFLLK